MTARLIFEATLIELSKVQAPSLKLYEFNYLFNKAINQYINKVYNVYDINQLTTDDLRVLKSTAYLTPVKFKHNTSNENSAVHNSNISAQSYLSKAHSSIQSLHGATYEVALPIDYLHLLNCVCIYYVAKQKDCWDAGSYIEVPAVRLTADSWSQIITDIYNRPSPMRPYYYIHNLNNQTKNDVLPTDPITLVSSLGMPDGTDMTGVYKVTTNSTITGTSESETITETYPDPSTTVATTTSKEGSNLPRTFKMDFNGDGTPETNVSLVEKPIALRAGNPSNVRMEIRYGRDDTLFLLKEVQIDYVKAPLFIRLTQEQIDLTEDTSQIMEFPDYVNQEIINELVHLVMERSADPRLGTNIQISNSIARPTQQLLAQAAQG